MKQIILFASIILVLWTSSGCTTHQLAKYNFEGRTMAVMAAIPPAPHVFSGYYGRRPYQNEHPIVVAARIGTAIAKEVQADKAEARLDSALQQLDVSERIAKRTLVNASQFLGYRPVSSVTKSDFIMDIRVRKYGIEAESWDGVTSMMIEGDVRIVDPATHQRIWKKEIRVFEKISRSMFGLRGTAAGDLLTARDLSKLTVEEMRLGFENLSDIAADTIANELREDYLKARK